MRRWIAGIGVLTLTAPTPVEHSETCTLQGTVTTRGTARGPVVVYVTGEGPPPSAPTEATISQRNKSFSEEAVVVSPGAQVSFPNEDAVHHDLYSHAPQDPFVFGRHAPGARPSRSFEEAGDVMVRCNIHPDMETHVLVVPNAFHASTDEDGSYLIEGITPGEHTVRAWSAWHRPVEQSVSCVPGQTVTFDATLRFRHPAGEDYMDKL